MKERINEQVPSVRPSCYVHKTAVLIGDVTACAPAVMCIKRLC